MNASPKEWILSGTDVRGLLAGAGIEPWPGSPFKRLPPATPQTSASAPASDDARLQALRRVAQPDVVLGAIASPPDRAGYAWFYGRADEPDLALLDEQPAHAFRLTWPVPRTDLVDLLTLALELDQPTLPRPLTLECDGPELMTLAAIVDIVQEDALVTLLNRLSGEPSRFDAASLQQSAFRSLSADDRRWMTPRLRRLVPVDLAPALDELGQGLERLCRRGFLTLSAGRYTPTRSFGVLCSMQAVCAGCCAVSVRVRSQGDGPTAWHHRHTALWRGAESLWMLDFTSLPPAPLAAVLTAVTTTLAAEALRASVLTPERAAIDDRTPAGAGARR